MDAVLRRAAQAAHLASLGPAARRFERAAREPATAQRARLRAVLRVASGSAYGRALGLTGSEDVAAFRRRAPIVRWSDLEPWVERVAAGEPDVLTTAPVLALEPTGGSTGRTKLLPLTRPLLAEIGAATGPWMRDLHRAHPRARGGPAYWCVSPLARGPRRTEGGVRIGLEDETEYFGPLARWGLRRLLAVPPEVARIADVDRWRRATLARLLAAKDLALVSVWSPTFLLRLVEAVERDADDVLAALTPRRADEVRRAVAAGPEGLGARLWPRLALVSCWTDGPSAAFLPDLRRRFPGVAVQGKGLLATEGVVSFPLEGAAAPVAAVASHFLELAPLDRPDDPVLVHEAEVGERYAPVLTTGGGLLRYRLDDVVLCVGHHRRAPLLRFEGRLDDVSDLCGEKVSPRQAEEALRRAWTASALAPSFALLAPSLEGRPHYRLYVEAEARADQLRRAEDAVERALAEAHPYGHCRALGQLGPVRAVRVRDGAAARERRAVEAGGRLGAAKPSALDPRPLWDDAFEEVAT